MKKQEPRIAQEANKEWIDSYRNKSIAMMNLKEKGKVFS